MARHRFDPVSLVLGGVAVASGTVVLADRSITDDASVLLPGGLIALGVALFIKVVRGDRPAAASTAAASGPVPVPPAVAPPGTDPTFTGGDPHPEDAPWPTAGDTDTPPGATTGPTGDDTEAAEDDDHAAP